MSFYEQIIAKQELQKAAEFCIKHSLDAVEICVIPERSKVFMRNGDLVIQYETDDGNGKFEIGIYDPKDD